MRARPIDGERVERDGYEQRILLSFHENESGSHARLEYPTLSTNKEIEEANTKKYPPRRPLRRRRDVQHYRVIALLGASMEDAPGMWGQTTEFKTTSRHSQTPRRRPRPGAVLFALPRSDRLIDGDYGEAAAYPIASNWAQTMTA